MSVIDAKEAPKVRVPDRVFCICYLVQFQKYKDKDILALLDFESEENTIIPAYIAKLNLKMQKTNIDT